MIGILLKHHLYLTFANSAKNEATFLIPTSFKPNLSISLNNSIPSPSRITRPPIPHYDRRSTSNRPRPPQLYSTVIWIYCIAMPYHPRLTRRMRRQVSNMRCDNYSAMKWLLCLSRPISTSRCHDDTWPRRPPTWTWHESYDWSYSLFFFTFGKEHEEE